MTNRTSEGLAFSEELIQKIWEKAQVIEGEDSNLVRKDICGAIIHRKDYGTPLKPLSFAWEIDHIKPIALGGTDDYYNLQPLHWENNRAKADEHPSWKCAVRRRDKQNEHALSQMFLLV